MAIDSIQWAPLPRLRLLQIPDYQSPKCFIVYEATVIDERRFIQFRHYDKEMTGTDCDDNGKNFRVALGMFLVGLPVEYGT